MKKRVIIIGGVVAAACLLGAGAWHFLKGKGKSSENVAYVTTVGSLTGEDVSGTQNRYAGVVEPQKTVEVKLDSGRAIQQLMVEEGQSVKAGDSLFSYDVSSGEEELATAKLELERLKTEAVSYQEQINTYQREKEKAPQEEQLSYTIQIQSAQMDLKKNEYDQKSKAAEIEKLEKVSDSPVVTSEIDGIVKTINKDAMGSGSDSPDSDSSGDSTAFITILGTGNYRVKGKVLPGGPDGHMEGLHGRSGHGASRQRRRRRRFQYDDDGWRGRYADLLLVLSLLCESGFYRRADAGAARIHRDGLRPGRPEKRALAGRVLYPGRGRQSLRVGLRRPGQAGEARRDPGRL